MSRSSFAVAQTLPVARIAVIRRPIAPPFARAEDPVSAIEDLIDLEAPTRRSTDLVRELAAASRRMDDEDTLSTDDPHEDTPTRMVAPQENLRLLAASFDAHEDSADTERPHPASDDEVTLPEMPAPITATRIATFADGFTAPVPESSVRETRRPESQTLVVAGIWAAALSTMGVLVFILSA